MHIESLSQYGISVLYVILSCLMLPSLDTSLLNLSLNNFYHIVYCVVKSNTISHANTMRTLSSTGWFMKTYVRLKPTVSC